MVSKGHLHFEIPIEMYLNFSASDWELIGKIVADMEQGKTDKNDVDREVLNVILNMYKKVLTIVRCAMCRNEEELEGFVDSDEETGMYA